MDVFLRAGPPLANSRADRRDVGELSAQTRPASRRHPAAHLLSWPVSGLRAHRPPSHAAGWRTQWLSIGWPRMPAEARRRSLTVAGAAQVVDAACAAALLFPVSPAWLQFCTVFRHQRDAGVYQPNVAPAARSRCRCYHRSIILDELNSLGTSSSRNSPNSRACCVAAERKPAAARATCDRRRNSPRPAAASTKPTRRIDALVERLAADARVALGNGSPRWNTDGLDTPARIPRRLRAGGQAGAAAVCAPLSTKDACVRSGPARCSAPIASR